MGLDMYLKGRKFIFTGIENEEKETEDGFEVREKMLDLGYWRKHPNLHGFIVESFAHEQEDDCEEIDLEADDIKKIIKAIKENKLPETTGFFFGKSDLSEEQMKRDLEIFEKALNWLETPDSNRNVVKSVYYRASW